MCMAYVKKKKKKEKKKRGKMKLVTEIQPNTKNQ